MAFVIATGASKVIASIYSGPINVFSCLKAACRSPRSVDAAIGPMHCIAAGGQPQHSNWEGTRPASRSPGRLAAIAVCLGGFSLIVVCFAGDVGVVVSGLAVRVGLARGRCRFFGSGWWRVRRTLGERRAGALQETGSVALRLVETRHQSVLGVSDADGDVASLLSGKAAVGQVGDHVAVRGIVTGYRSNEERLGCVDFSWVSNMAAECWKGNTFKK